MANRKYLLQLLSLVVFGALALASWAARAGGMDQSMLAQFGAMTNVTNAGVYETQAARVISGGSIVYRSKVASLRLMALEAPRLRADCNGIDAYGGSLSFISGEAFTQFLRNLSTAAPAYAFNMALAYLCKDCEQHLAKLQKLAQDMNALTINSCKIDFGQTMKQVKQIGEDIDAVTEEGKKMGSNFVGAVSDFFATREGGAQKLDDAASTGNQDAQKRVAAANGNAVANIVRNNNIQNWWGGTLPAQDLDEFINVIASFTGHVSTFPTDTQDDPAKTKEQTVILAPILFFDDFMNGGPHKVYKCPDQKCNIKPDSPQTTAILPSYRKRVFDMLAGDGTPGAGVLGKMNDRASRGGIPHTVVERNFIASLPPGVYANIREMAASPATAASYVSLISDWIAAEMTYEYLMDVIGKMRVAAASTEPRTIVSEWVRNLNTVEEGVREGRRIYGESVRSYQATLHSAALFRENVGRSRTSGVTIPR